MYFFPYKVDRSFGIPWLTIGLIATNVIIFVVQVSVGLDSSINALGFRPDLLGLVTWIPAMFMHADIMHLAGNMYFLWLFGSLVEDAIGRGRYLAIYVASGAAAALLHGLIAIALMPEALGIPTIGASGAIAGIMGVTAVRFYKTRLRVAYFIFYTAGTFAISSAFGIGLWFAGQVLDGVIALSGVESGVAYWAHIGGLLLGVSVAYFSGFVRSASREYLAQDAEQWSAGFTQKLAAEKYAQLAAEEPDNPEWHRKEAMMLAQERPPQYDRAREEFLAAYALVMNARDFGTAFDIHTEAWPYCGSIARTPTELLALAAEAERQLEAAEAGKLYSCVLERFGDTPSAERATFGLAQTQLRMGLAEEARATWKRFVERYPYSDFIGFADPELAG